MKLRVWHVPQVPGQPFYVYTDDIREAVKILNILSAYDLFQLENNIKPDFSNMNGIEMWDEKENEWVDWYIETEDDFFDDTDLYFADDKDMNNFSEQLFMQLNVEELGGYNL